MLGKIAFWIGIVLITIISLGLFWIAKRISKRSILRKRISRFAEQNDYVSLPPFENQKVRLGENERTGNTYKRIITFFLWDETVYQGILKLGSIDEFLAPFEKKQKKPLHRDGFCFLHKIFLTQATKYLY